MLTGKIGHAFYRAIFESMTPTELALEYTRATGELPPNASTSGDMIRRMLSEHLIVQAQANPSHVLGALYGIERRGC